LVVLREPKIYHDLADFTRIVDFTWRVSDCEELVGGKITAPLCSTSKNNVEQLRPS